MTSNQFGRKKTISEADNKWKEWKEEHLKSKNKSCQPKRKTSPVERAFLESARKPSQIDQSRKLLMVN